MTKMMFGLLVLLAGERSIAYDPVAAASPISTANIPFILMVFLQLQ
jgi:hypothetical protein